jgi:Na+-driven multidrug efflux pump
MTFIFGIILAALFFFFHNEIINFFVSSGLRDNLVLWLQRSELAKNLFYSKNISFLFVLAT